MIRIVCCIDVDAPTPEDAYTQLRRRLDLLCMRMGWGWESTDDEWYDHDGHRLSKEEITAAFDEYTRKHGD